jgi:excisionase family DNA binding protein
MATKKQSDRNAQTIAEAVERIRAERLGRTVAEAAAQLGISRQAVHKAIRRGDLKAATVKGYEGQLLTQFIPQEYIDAFKAKRGQRLAG